MEHTPGRWDVIEGEPHTIVSGEGDHIADIWLVANGFKEANARLMAAAPDMLEALKRLLEWSDHDPNCIDNCPVCNAYVNAKEAIAKAEGRE